MTGEIRNLLRADIVGFVLSLLVLFIGLAALAVQLLRLKSKDRILLWFGLFLGVYGLRALARQGIFVALFDAPARFWDYVQTILSNVIVTPAILFFETVYGVGWRSSLRWLLYAQAAWGAVAIVVDFLRHTPGSMPDPANLLLVVMPLLVAVGYFRGYRPPQSAWAAIIFAGGSAFVISVIVDHLHDAAFTRWRVGLEPFGFLVNLVCLGYVAVQRFVTNEQQLVAIQEEMKSAARIQASILPRSVPAVAGLRIAVKYIPMTAVAGDFYDFMVSADGGLGVLVADVTGHGVPAALIASMVKVAASSQAEHAGDPPRVVSALNQVMCRQARGQLTTAGYLFIEPGVRRAVYAAAGHPPLLHWRKATGKLHELRENGLVLGVIAAAKYDGTPIELEPGDRLVLYTDGIPEAPDAVDEPFGDERLAEFIATHQELPAETFADALLAKVSAWSGNGSRGSHADDITLIVVDVPAY